MFHHLLLLLLGWGTHAHNMILDYAFDHPYKWNEYRVSARCLEKMKEGSRNADGISYQDSRHSYMHAMHSQDQSVEEAIALMKTFIVAQYEGARALKIRDPDTSCFLRGMALHPVMDSTSPLHGRMALWTLTNFGGHGDVSLPGFPSGEGPYTLDDQPQFLEMTAALLHEIDTNGMKGYLRAPDSKILLLQNSTNFIQH